MGTASPHGISLTTALTTSLIILRQHRNYNIAYLYCIFILYIYIVYLYCIFILYVYIVYLYGKSLGSTQLQVWSLARTLYCVRTLYK